MADGSVVRDDRARDAGSATSTTKAGDVIGWVALIVALLLWAGFALSLRAIGDSPLTIADVALIRFGVPAVVLAPVVPFRLASLRGVSPGFAAMVAIGGGLPFFLLAAIGGKLSSAAHISALIAGTSPLAVAFLSFAIWRERPSKRNLPGFAAIILGVVLLAAGLHVAGASAIGGVGLLLGASLLWSAYTIALRRGSIGPLTAVMVVSYSGLIVIAVLIATGLLNSRLFSVPFDKTLPFVLIQGFGTGIFSVASYAIAVRHLGALRCATVGALAPVLSTVLAIPILHEVASHLSMLGVIAITIGVVAASRSEQRSDKQVVKPSPTSG